MEWVELLKLTGPAGAVLLVLILAPWIVLFYVGRWFLNRLISRLDADIESRIKLASALEALTIAIRDK